MWAKHSNNGTARIIIQCGQKRAGIPYDNSWCHNGIPHCPKEHTQNDYCRGTRKETDLGGFERLKRHVLDWHSRTDGRIPRLKIEQTSNQPTAKIDIWHPFRPNESNDEIIHTNGAILVPWDASGGSPFTRRCGMIRASSSWKQEKKMEKREKPNWCVCKPRVGDWPHWWRFAQKAWIEESARPPWLLQTRLRTGGGVLGRLGKLEDCAGVGEAKELEGSRSHVLTYICKPWVSPAVDS